MVLLVPTLEISLLIWVGGQIGALPTLSLLMLAATLGVSLLQSQSLATLAAVRASLARRELPTTALLEGVVLLICAVLLISPGFFSDMVALIGLIPPVRRFLVKRILRSDLLHNITAAPSPETSQSRTLEGEFWHDDPPP